MPTHPDAEVSETEVWVRCGEVYIPDAPELFARHSIVAVYPGENGVSVYVAGKGKMDLSELLKPKLEAVK